MVLFDIYMCIGPKISKFLVSEAFFHQKEALKIQGGNSYFFNYRIQNLDETDFNFV